MGKNGTAGAGPEYDRREASVQGVDRRGFFTEAGLVTAGLVVGAALPAVALGEAAAGPPTELFRLATFLTGKADLSPELVQRALDALGQEDATFGPRAGELGRQIDGAQLADVEAFRASPLAGDASLMATAVELIGALYLGCVVKDQPVRLVSYEEALMYRPTADVTVIPTYARGGPNYWSRSPKP